MEKAVIETSAGFMGLCWTGAGISVLTLPAPTAYDAEREIAAEVEGLVKKHKNSLEAAGGTIDLSGAEKELKDYFSGKRVGLSFPVDWSHYTEFQKKVLQRVYSLPWGQVASYGQIAADIGNPRGARAVGGAVGSNRVLLVVPCHRVIGHGGSLGGFGSGLEWKKRLLNIEGIRF